LPQNIFWENTEPLFTEEEIEELLDTEEWLWDNEDKRCECGADKLKSPRHDWFCPKYEK